MIHRSAAAALASLPAHPRGRNRVYTVAIDGRPPVYVVAASPSAAILYAAPRLGISASLCGIHELGIKDTERANLMLDLIRALPPEQRERLARLLESRFTILRQDDPQHEKTPE